MVGRIIAASKTKMRQIVGPGNGSSAVQSMHNWQEPMDMSLETNQAIATADMEPSGELEVLEQQIFDFFAQELQAKSLGAFLSLFQAFFIDHNEAQLPERLRELGAQMMLENQHAGFIRVLKRCCYLFIEACFLEDKPEQIRQIVQLLMLPPEQTGAASASITHARFRDWLRGCVYSGECRVFRALAPSSETNPYAWGDRYIMFTLFAQSIDPDVSPEQQRASGMLYQFFRARYRFQLAMYLSTQGNMTPSGVVTKNPTLIEDVTLNLIRRLVLRKKPSYPELATQFTAQITNQTLASWQTQFIDYLFSGMTSPRRLKWLPEKFTQYLKQRYPHGEMIHLEPAVVNHISMNLIDYLLDPSCLQDLSHPLPVLMIQREYLTLSILLLKLVLLAPENHGRLLWRLNILLEQYREHPKAECQWLRGFFETIQVVLVLVLPSPRSCPMVTASGL